LGRLISRILNTFAQQKVARSDDFETPGSRDLREKVADIPFWFHSIDLGCGVVTPGIKSLELLRRELRLLNLPDLRGKTVLDVGAWDGYFSFAAEGLGAERVVALDHHVWGLDREAKNRYKAEGKVQGIPERHPKEIPELWRFDELPGKRGFDLAHKTLDSKVEAVVCDLMNVEEQKLGKFDVVLFLGVLYHMENPVESLRIVRKLTNHLAVIETEAMEIAGQEDRPICEFFPPSAKLMDDPTNFWAPNLSGVKALCEAAGFSRVETFTKRPVPKKRKIARYRTVIHAFV
jgi:tRNA (mo5U34)-methyltransferase